MPTLNTMFNHAVNATCNNAAFSYRKIPPMERSIHESMRRLYQAAKTKLGHAPGPSELARELETSAQVVKHWEARGISKDGALIAQARFGIDANQLLTNDRFAPPPPKPSHKASEPQPWDWPFAEVTTSDWATLRADEKSYVESGIKMMIKARDAPPKQTSPESYTIATRTG